MHATSAAKVERQFLAVRRGKAFRGALELIAAEIHGTQLVGAGLLLERRGRQEAAPRPTPRSSVRARRARGGAVPRRTGRATAGGNAETGRTGKGTDRARRAGANGATSSGASTDTRCATADAGRA